MRIFLLLLLSLAGCVSEQVEYPIEPVVAEGDIVLLNYISRVKDTGELVKTSYEALAKAEGFQEGSYGPINITVGSGLMPSIENAIIGMRIEEEKTVLVPPSETYGEYIPELVMIIPRVAVLPKISEVPIGRFNVKPREGEYIELKYWSARVVEVTNESIALRHEPENGSMINTSYGKAVVLLNSTHVTTILSPEVDAIVTTSLGDARIIDFDEDTVTLDYNHPLAGKTLEFTIKIEGIEKAKK